MRLPRFIVALVLLAMLPAFAQAPHPLRVAAAADLQWALPEIAQQFEAATGEKVELIFGSSGNFYAQIQNGAPFDVFLSADSGYPQRLVASGAASKQSYTSYAQGQLAIWLAPATHLDHEKLGVKALLDPAIKKIAIANPEHAPYGRAAVAALQAAGVYDQLRGKLVMGENISQAAQFVQSGNAQAGVLALSSSMRGQAQSGGELWILPQQLYPPIQQAAVVVANSAERAAAEKFVRFLRSSAARAIFKKYGFSPPAGDP
jgi:molybdate transport system substrate-binding protein